MAAGKSPRESTAKLVERHMRNWELARAQRSDAPVPERQEVHDFIAISRSVGSGGLEVAKRVGESLRWPVFDRELLDVMAGDDELRRRIYASMDERDMSWCEETLQVLLRPEMVKNDYFHRLTKTILTLARQGNAVFVGRGCDLILPRGAGFRVRVVASLELCVETYRAEHGLSAEAARAEVERIEQERAEFIKHHFGADVAGPSRYDLVINLSRFAIDQAVAVILSARYAIGGGK
ncbi:MAG: cytidylate kinase-like family protein [Phycisphaerae bacterium]|jgi:cytidylate kinase